MTSDKKAERHPHGILSEAGHDDSGGPFSFLRWAGDKIDFSPGRPFISESILKKWQGLVNLMARTCETSAALIIKTEPKAAEILVGSENDDNPYRDAVLSGDNWVSLETESGKEDPHIISDLSVSKKYRETGDFKLGVAAYLGCPVGWSNGEIFGVVFVADTKVNEFDEKVRELVSHFRDIVAGDILSLERERFHKSFLNLFPALSGSLSSEILVVVDEKIAYASISALDRLGYGTGELTGDSILGLVSPDDREAVVDHFKGATMVGRGLSSIFCRLKCKGGDTLWSRLGATKMEWKGKFAVVALITGFHRESPSSSSVYKKDVGVADVPGGSICGFSFYDGEGKFVKGNPAFFELVGKGAMSDYSLFDDPLLNKPGNERLRDDLRKGMAIEAPIEGWFTSDDPGWSFRRGETCLRALFIVIKDARDRLTDFVAIHEDITGRRLAQEVLRERASRYRTLFEDSPISLWEEDLSEVKRYLDEIVKSGVGNLREYLDKHPDVAMECASKVKVLDVNQATLETYGAKSKEDFVEGLGRVFSEESLEASKELLLAFAEGKTTAETEGINLTLTGEKRHFYIRVSVASGYEKTYSKVLVSIIDVTERKLAEEALRDSEERYRTVVENAAEGILVVQDGILRYVNPYGANFSGYKSDEMIGRPIWDNIHPDDRDYAMNISQKRQEGRKVPAKYELRTIDISGATKWIEVSGVRILWEGKPATLLFCNDATQRKEDELALKSQIEFEKLITSISTEFINMEAAEIDSEIGGSLEDISKIIDCDRSFMLQFSEDEKYLRLSHGYYQPIVDYPSVLKGDVETTTFPWIIGKMKNLENVYVASPESLPEEAANERDYMKRAGVAAFAVIPLVRGGKMIAALIFSWSEGHKVKGRNVVAYLRVIGEIFSNALERKQFDESIQAKNIALKEVINQIDDEKKQMKQHIQANISKRIMPLIMELKQHHDEVTVKRVELLEEGLKEITSPFISKLEQKFGQLTSRETEICNMIRSGRTSKDIALTLNLSLPTVHKHRETIRKKLGIANTDTNLYTYLQQL